MFLLLFVFSVICLFWNRKYSLFIWFSSALLIPYFVRIYPIPVSYELCFTFVFFIYALYTNYNKKYLPEVLNHRKWVILFPIYYVAVRIVLAFLGGYFSYSEILELSYFNMLFLSVMVFSVWVATDNTTARIANKIISIVLLCVCIYGVFTYIIRSNPYLEILTRFTGSTRDFVGQAERYASEIRGGLSSRISVLTYNPLQYAILLNAFIFIPIYQYIKSRVFFYILVAGLLVLNIFLTGSRGPLIALLFSVSFFFIIYQNFTSKIKYLFLGVLFFSLIMILPGFEKYATFIKSILFIFDESASEAADITGSSVSGRLIQLEGVLDLIQGLGVKTILFGYGAGYTEYYISLNGYDTEVMGFESILFSSLVNYGIVGFILVDVVPWFIFFFSIRDTRKKKLITRGDSYLLYSMLLTNVIYSFLVGYVYYVIYFSIFYCLMKQMILYNFQKKISLISILKNETI